MMEDMDKVLNFFKSKVRERLEQGEEFLYASGFGDLEGIRTDNFPEMDKIYFYKVLKELAIKGEIRANYGDGIAQEIVINK